MFSMNFSSMQLFELKLVIWVLQGNVLPCISILKNASCLNMTCAVNFLGLTRIKTVL